MLYKNTIKIFTLSFLVLISMDNVKSQSSWKNVGTAGFTPDANRTAMALDKNGTPYIVFQEYIPQNFQATVMKYDGSAWVLVGNSKISVGPAAYPDIAIDNNGMPYIVYGDGNNGGRVTVMKFDGIKWITVGNAGFSDSGEVLHP